MPISKRIFDIIFATLALPFVLFLFIPICLIIKFTSRGPALIWSDRVGINNQIFKMPKFRTMRIDTPQVATHLLINPKMYLTPFGIILRQTSLDEIPQILSVLTGSMSMVGPRPALFNQFDLIEMRTNHKIHTLKPGLTGWAQVNGRDELTLSHKVELDLYYLNNANLLFDLKIVFLTVYKVFKRESVSH